MAYIITKDRPPRVLCKAGIAWPVRWQAPQEEAANGAVVLLVPKDALRYETEHGADEGARIYGGIAAQVAT